jgi:hypothetical protein
MIIRKIICHSILLAFTDSIAFRIYTNFHLPHGMPKLRGVAGYESLTTSLTLHILSYLILHYTSFPAQIVAEDTHEDQEREADTRTDGYIFSSSTHSGYGFPCGSSIKAMELSPLL